MSQTKVRWSQFQFNIFECLIYFKIFHSWTRYSIYTVLRRSPKSELEKQVGLTTQQIANKASGNRTSTAERPLQLLPGHIRITTWICAASGTADCAEKQISSQSRRWYDSNTELMRTHEVCLSMIYKSSYSDQIWRCIGVPLSQWQCSDFFCKNVLCLCNVRMPAILTVRIWVWTDAIRSHPTSTGT